MDLITQSSLSALRRAISSIPKIRFFCFSRKTDPQSSRITSFSKTFLSAAVLHYDLDTGDIFFSKETHIDVLQ